MSLSRRDLLRIGALVSLIPTSILQACGVDTESARLAFLNWNDYISPDTIASYEKEFDATVSYQTYESNDELGKLLRVAQSVRRGGRKATTYDLAVPSGSALGGFIRDGLIQKLDKKLLPDWNPSIQRPFDPKNEWSVPWATGVTAIGYDIGVFSDGPPTWDLFLSNSFKGRVTLLNEKQEALSAALLQAGDDPNSTDAPTLTKAAATLKKMLSVARLDSSQEYWRNLADGKVVAAQGFSSDIALARERAAKAGRKIGFVIPKTGATRWVDSLVIPAGAPHPKRAYELINYVLRPEVSAAISSAVRVDTANPEARALLKRDIAEDSFTFPKDVDLKRCVFAADLGKAQALWTTAWDQATSN